MKLFNILVLSTVILVPVVGASQGSPSVSAPAAGSSGLPGFGRNAGEGAGPFAAGTQERLEKGRQTDRQKRLIADTDRLLNLATQLKADVDKTTKDTLSIEVIKKAEEIEKLAKSVKERMRG